MTKREIRRKLEELESRHDKLLDVCEKHQAIIETLVQCVETLQDAVKNHLEYQRQIFKN